MGAGGKGSGRCGQPRLIAGAHYKRNRGDAFGHTRYHRDGGMHKICVIGLDFLLTRARVYYECNASIPMLHFPLESNTRGPLRSLWTRLQILFGVMFGLHPVGIALGALANWPWSG